MLKRVSFFLLIFCLPFQLGLHFWPNSSYVAGFKIDYYSPTLYLFDLILIFNLILHFNNLLLWFKKIQLGQYFPFVLVFAFNLYRSGFSLPTLYFWVRLLELGLFAFLLLDTPDLLSSIKKPFIFSLILICLLGLLQASLQHSLQGPFYYLGERLFGASTPNLAYINLSGLRLVRPYSTFSHPNSFAGYLLISSLILSLFGPFKRFKTFVFGLILLTASRVALLAYLITRFLRPSKFQLLVIFLLLSTLPFYYHFFPVSFFDKEVSSRLALLLATIKLSASTWLFGLGFNRFISQLPFLLPASGISNSTLQPVHNTLLLLVLELGVFPILFLIPYFKKILNSQFSILNSIILITGSLDHYWLTLPQNRLVIVLAMVLLFRYGSKRNNHSYRRGIKG